MTDVIYEMSSKKLGMTTVQEDGRLRGVISDGDLRRLLEREGGAALTSTAGEAMNPHPRDDRGQRIRREGAGDSGGAQDHVAGRRRCDGNGRRRRAPARSLGRGADLVWKEPPSSLPDRHLPPQCPLRRQPPTPRPDDPQPAALESFREDHHQGLPGWIAQSHAPYVYAGCA